MKNQIMTYEEEYKEYIKALPPLDIIEMYIEEKNTGMLQKILSEYKVTHKKLKTQEAINDIISGTCPIKKALRKLYSRTEEEEENDRFEQEYLQKAMYG